MIPLCNRQLILAQIQTRHAGCTQKIQISRTAHFVRTRGQYQTRSQYLIGPERIYPLSPGARTIPLFPGRWRSPRPNNPSGRERRYFLRCPQLDGRAENRISPIKLAGTNNNISGNSGYSGNSKIVAAQKAIKGTKKQIEIARHLISQKIINSIETLEKSVPKSDRQNFALDRLGQKFREFKNPGLA